MRNILREDCSRFHVKFNLRLEGRFNSTFNTSIADQGCDPKGNFSMIVHGWKEHINTTWVNTTVSRLLKHRGGCVFFMDYSIYSQASNYFNLVPHFGALSELLTRKFNQIENYDNQYCFGFSFGARLCVDSGTAVGNQTIARMDVCELAGPGFDTWFGDPRRVKDPKWAAKNVACISTSSDKGTTNYNCHQNYRMGVCGNTQAAAGPYPMGHHGLCPYFYNSAFDYKFIPNNFYNCSSNRMASFLFEDVRMGYLANFNTNLVQGDIFIATAKFPPYLVVNNVIDNKPVDLKLKHLKPFSQSQLSIDKRKTK